MAKSRFFLLVLPWVALALTAAEPAQKSEKVPPAETVTALTPEQKTALAAIDARLAGLDAIAAKVDDAEYKATVLSEIDDIKKRRLALEKNFDQGLYEALMHSVISRYQIIALWLKPPALPPPPGYKPSPPPKKVPSDKKDPHESLPGNY